MTKNYQILKEQINHSINNSGLDIGAAYFILKDVMNNLEHLYYAQINKECLEEAQNKAKGNPNDELNVQTNKDTISIPRKEDFHAKCNYSPHPAIYR